MLKINSLNSKPKKIHSPDDIEINGKIFFIPDKWVANEFLSYEQKRVYKYILAMLINNFLDTNSSSKFKKNVMDNLQHQTDCIISYLMMGKITGNVKIGMLEQSIISKIPQQLFTTQNLMLCEKIE